jgi:hypothetical protein
VLVQFLVLNRASTSVVDINKRNVFHYVNLHHFA